MAAWPLDTNKATGCGPYPQASCGLWWHLGDSAINIDLSCGRTTDPDITVDSNLGLTDIMTSGDGKGHPDQYTLSGNMVCRPAKPTGVNTEQTSNLKFQTVVAVTNHEEDGVKKS